MDLIAQAVEGIVPAGPPIVVFNAAIGLIMTALFFYQAIFMVVGALRGEYRYPAASKLHRYAFLIAAHNEEPVIANLVESLRAQDYPAELFDIYVVADACTDATAEAARAAGAIVYERNDLARRGKSWVMDYAFKRILAERPGLYEGFFIFDADNLVSRDYLRIMNDAFDQGHMVVTGYRNSKNFGDSWISGGYGTSFLREARFLNNARMHCGTSCAVSGSGYLVSARIVEAMQGWRFHTLTEDIQFTTFCAVHGVRIAYAPAEFFDEQPVRLAASWKQRLRWCKGFYQVLFTYGRYMLKAIVLFRRFAAYDMFVTIAPAILLTLLSVLTNGTFLVVSWLSHGFLATDAEMSMCLGSIFMSFAGVYGTFFMIGLVTTVFERGHIHGASRRRILLNLFTYPLFMLTYIPINAQALFQKVEWVPTPHTVAVKLDDVMGRTR